MRSNRRAAIPSQAPPHGRPRCGTAQRAILLALCAIPLGLWGCAGQPGPEASQREDALRIGVTPGYAPLVFRADGGLAGIEIDFGRAAAAELGAEPVFVESSREALIPSLEAGRIDVIMSGMSITDERSARVLFTTPYLRVGQLALIRRADIMRFGPPARMRQAGVRVGYVRDTTGQQFVRGDLTRSVSYAFESVEDGVRSLRAGRIDYFIHDAPTIWRIAHRPGEIALMGLYHPLTQEHLAWAVRRDNVALKDRLDAILGTWRAQNQLDPILDRWIPVRVKVGQ